MGAIVRPFIGGNGVPPIRCRYNKVENIFGNLWPKELEFWNRGGLENQLVLPPSSTPEQDMVAIVRPFIGGNGVPPIRCPYNKVENISGNLRPKQLEFWNRRA